MITISTSHFTQRGLWWVLSMSLISVEPSYREQVGIWWISYTFSMQLSDNMWLFQKSLFQLIERLTVLQRRKRELARESVKLQTKVANSLRSAVEKNFLTMIFFGKNKTFDVFFQEGQNWCYRCISSPVWDEQRGGEKGIWKNYRFCRHNIHAICNRTRTITITHLIISCKKNMFVLCTFEVDLERFKRRETRRSSIWKSTHSRWILECVFTLTTVGSNSVSYPLFSSKLGIFSDILWSNACTMPFTYKLRIKCKFSIESVENSSWRNPKKNPKGRTRTGMTIMFRSK